MITLNETHDPALRSWVTSGNVAGSDFTVQNLPHAVFRRRGTSEAFRGGVAIGNEILDLARVHERGALERLAPEALAMAALDKAARGSLNELMAMGPEAWASLRLILSRALRQFSVAQSLLEKCLLAQSDAEFALPAQVGDYTDFYSSIHHATAVGRLMRPDNPLLPNYKWLPVGYHGRASSIGISGQTFSRPTGQRMPAGGVVPVVGASERLDYELELGVFIGPGNPLGTRIDISTAESHVFGLCLLNDWSARDLQAWEYQPLGPFLGKNFATTLSPWVVTLEALAPHRVPWTRVPGDPQPLEYLRSDELFASGAIDIELEVWFQTAAMSSHELAPVRLSRSNFKDCYWSIAQLIAHHTVNGCNLRPADLFGTGTLSGPGPNEAGSLLELSRGGSQPIALPNGETRRFLEDGDRVIFRGWGARLDYARVGFGEVTGQVSPAG